MNVISKARQKRQKIRAHDESDVENPVSDRWWELCGPPIVPLLQKCLHSVTSKHAGPGETHLFFVLLSDLGTPASVIP